ncbi:MAG: oligopeptide transporter, OPT family [Proteobacteria bacterium]|nr:oligopeptide transporter, OPT family [Pseudomonadota bacterium]
MDDSALNTPQKRISIIPENAYSKLTEGEDYQPIVLPTDTRAELTSWSITVGLIMTAIFAAACVYIGLRSGNGIEASIPIAILAIFFGKMKKMKSTILENVIVQSIGQASGVVAAGAAFLVPALYINDLEPMWWQIFLACFIGGSLGVVLIIPLRKYFVRDLHGELPFPEATAVNEILCSGESTGQTAGKVLIIAFLLGAIFDFLIEAVNLWPAVISTSQVLGSTGETMAAHGFEISIEGIAALFGLGYIIGLKYAAIIASGSVLAMVVIVPLIYMFGSQTSGFELASVAYNISEMSASDIFDVFVQKIGIGAIAVSGIIGIIQMGKIVGGSISLGFRGLKSSANQTYEPRTQIDITPKNVMLIQFGMAALLGVLFFIIATTTTDSATGQTYVTFEAVKYAAVGAIVGYILSFLFTPVAAHAIAIVGVNPVSGMTLITVVFTISVLVAFGLKGAGGMFVALVVGTAVCTALSTSGALISDFKIGYWIGSTPRHQERWKFLGLAVASMVVALVIPVMDSGYGFVKKDRTTGEPLRDKAGNLISNTEKLPAPQANMIATVSRGLLNDPSKQPWLLYGMGGIMAIVLFLAGVPMLAFALGMYLPIGINTAVLAGAFTAWVVSKTGKSDRQQKARAEQGILIASGMIAGAAIFGIITALLRLEDLGALIHHISYGVKMKVENGILQEGSLRPYYENHGQLIALIMLVLLAISCFLLARWGANGTLREEEARSRTKKRPS